MDDAVARYCDAASAGDMTALGATLAGDVELPSPVIGRAVFRGREDVVAVLSAVYGLLGPVRWEQTPGEGPRRLAIAHTTVAGMRLDDAMIFELGEDGLITRVRPHLRPLLATIVFFLLLGPRMAQRAGVILRAMR